MASTAPYDRPRDMFPQLVGLGRIKTLALSTVAVISTVVAFAACGWAIMVTTVAADRVERYVVYLDDANLPVAMARVGQAWDAKDGAFLDFSMRWVRDLRARPQDIDALKSARGSVIKSTDRDLYGQLQATMQEADEVARTSAVTVDKIGANMIKRTGNKASVLVRWVEQIKGGNNKAKRFSATLDLAYLEPNTRREFGLNPLGIWATGFQITQQEDVP